jgi:TonB family protein
MTFVSTVHPVRRALIVGLGLLSAGSHILAQAGSQALAQAKLIEPPRLREAYVPGQPVNPIGGGEVVLELTVNTSGAISSVRRLRTTPPYTDFLADAVTAWRFTPATAVFDKREVPVDAPALVVGVFRPPSVYSGPSSASPPQILGSAARSLPQIASLAMPSYSPTLIGDGIVIVEIELSERAEPRDYRVLSPASGFDSAALAAVRAWRFTPPSTGPPKLFVYAVLGFRSPTGATVRPKGK